MFLSGNCNTNIKVVNVRTCLNKTDYDPVSQAGQAWCRHVACMASIMNDF